MPDIAANLAAIRARIDAACVAAGRKPGDVALLPVSKTKPVADIVAAYDAGCRLFGENRVQEAGAKFDELHERYPDLGFSIIGHLQTNKARDVARFATQFQALDSVAVARELDKRLQAAGRQLDVLVQVNTSAEPQKSGVALGDALALTEQLRSFDALRARGLMTIAVHSEDEPAVGACFDRLVELQRQLRDRDGGGWDELSMGMSGDFELAVAKGSTCVRVGRAVFGARPTGAAG